MIVNRTTTIPLPTSSWYRDNIPFDMIKDQLEAMLQRENEEVYQYCSCFCCSTKMLARRRRRESARTHQSRRLLQRMTFHQHGHNQDFEERHQQQQEHEVNSIGDISSDFSSSEDHYNWMPSAITMTTRVYDHRQSPIMSQQQQYNDLLHQEQENDYICRKRMCEWSYQIVDSLGFHREVVAIAFNYLDRFTVFQQIFRRITDYIYKLVSITALYIALKVHNRTTIKASTLSSLSRGEITVGDIISMESLMLDALSYHLSPPTCYTFISLFYAFVPVSVRQSAAGHPLMQHAVYLTELSVMDVSFRSLKASHIALAAMLNVMEMMGEETIPSWARCHFIRDVEECMLKVALEQESKNVTVGDGVVVGAISAGATSSIEGIGTECSGEESDSSLSHQPLQHDEEVLLKTVLWRCVDRARYLLHAFLSRDGYDFEFETSLSEQLPKASNRGNDIEDKNDDLVPLETQVDRNTPASDPDSNNNMSGIDASSVLRNSDVDSFAERNTKR